MTCDICGRGACMRSFHSIAEQERHDVRRLFADELEELEHLRAENERLQKRLTAAEQEWATLMKSYEQSSNGELRAELDALREIIAVARNDAGGNAAILIANGVRKTPIVLPLPENEMREVAK